MVGWAAFFHPYEVAWGIIPRDTPIRGVWWAPERPGERVPGTLTVPKFGHPRIHFEGGDELLTLPFGAFDVLHGRVLDAGHRPATVFRSIAQPHGKAYAPSTSEQTDVRIVDITVNSLLVGRHLDGETEGAITSVSVVSSYLHAWAQFHGFSDGPVAPEHPTYEVNLRRKPLKMFRSPRM